MTDTGRRRLYYLKGVHGFRGVSVVLTQLSAARLSGTDFFYHLRSKLEGSLKKPKRGSNSMGFYLIVSIIIVINLKITVTLK